MKKQYKKILWKCLDKMTEARTTSTQFEKNSMYAEAEGMLKGLLDFEACMDSFKRGKNGKSN